MIKVSVILPVYNEEKYIAKNLENILKFSKNRPYYHFILVNDGSTDKTKYIVETMLKKAKTNRIELISYDDNKGKGYAVKSGVNYATGDYTCYIDSDLAYSLEHLEILVEKLEYFDIVIGCRNLVPENIECSNLLRQVAGKIFNLLSRVILDLPFTDMQAGIKGFKTDVAKHLFKRQKITGFSFDVELIYVAHKAGYKIGEIPAIVSKKHLFKNSKVKIFSDSIKMFSSLLTIRANHRFTRYSHLIEKPGFFNNTVAKM